MTKFTSCSDCENEYNGVICINCEHNKRKANLFSPKIKSDLNKLFKGAPVVGSYKGSDDDSEYFGYFTGYNEQGYPLVHCKGTLTEFVQFAEIKLPTIEESPRNMWLAPPVEMPRELMYRKDDDNGLRYCYRLKGNKCVRDGGATVVTWSNVVTWSDVEAFMLLDNFDK